MSTADVPQYMDPCVCVQSASEKSGSERTATRKPQDGGVCVHSYTLFAAMLACYTTTVTMYFDSSSVSIPNTSTITLILLGGGSDARS